MRSIDLRVQNAVRTIERLLRFFEARLTESRPLISKDIAFFTFSRYEKLSKLLHDFIKKGSGEGDGFAASANLLSIQEVLEQTFLDPQLLEDLATTLNNTWPFLENSFCADVDVTDCKKEITVKLKVQAHSEFSHDREDVAVLSLILFEEFCRYVDLVAGCLGVLFLNPRTVAELQHAEHLNVCKGFRRFFELEKGHGGYTDFYQKLIRFLSALSDSFENNIMELKAFRHQPPEPAPEKLPLLIGQKHSVYKEFVQKKITGLISLIQKKTAPPGKGEFDDMTSDFLTNIVNEVSMQQFEEHLKELGSLGKV